LRRQHGFPVRVAKAVPLVRGRAGHLRWSAAMWRRRGGRRGGGVTGGAGFPRGAGGRRRGSLRVLSG
jgi:hypothetical protein